MTIDVMVAAVVALFAALTGLTGTIWHALLTGKLVFGREVEERDTRIDELTTSYQTAIGKLDDTQAKERASLHASVAAAEQRTAEIGSRLDRLIEQMAATGQSGSGRST